MCSVSVSLRLTAKDITVHTAFTEEEMLQRFIYHWQQDFPDIVTGWNVKFFDIPYLVNRIKRVLGEDRSEEDLSVEQDQGEDHHEDGS